jgi:hypothetical protein
VTGPYLQHARPTGFRSICEGVYYSHVRYQHRPGAAAQYRLAIRGRTGMWYLTLERAGLLLSSGERAPVAKIGPFVAVRLAKRAANDLLTSYGLRPVDPAAAARQPTSNG